MYQKSTKVQICTLVDCISKEISVTCKELLEYVSKIHRGSDRNRGEYLIHEVKTGQRSNTSKDRLNLDFV